MATVDEKVENIPPEDDNSSQNSVPKLPPDENSKGSTTGQEEKEKLYDMSRIRAFGNVPFLIKRTEPQDMTLTYGEAVDKVQILLEFLESNKVPAGAGIALRITDHTPASCLLILAILNHKCHFYPTDKMLLSQALYERMSMAGVEYLLVNKHLAVGHLNFTRLSSILLFNEDCKLYKVKHKPTDPAVQAKKPLPANMCYTISTTGSTGSPKLIHVPYECIAPNIVALSQKLNVSMADIIYLGTPCTFDPFVVEFFLALQNGATLLTSHHSMKDSPSRVLSALFPDNLVKPGISILQMTPSLFRQFGATSIRERVLSSSSSLRVLLLGGEPFPSNAELVTWMDPSVLLQKHICNIYGITEISCWSLLHIVQSLQSQISLGTPIDEDTILQIKCQNDGDSQQGELLLGSATRRCYIPEIDDKLDTQKGDSSICFRATGDLVTRLKDGTILYGERANDVVKRAGNRISLGLITRKIQKCLLSSELATCLWLEDLQKLICCIRTQEPKTRVQQRAQTFDILSKVSIAEQPDRFVYLQHFPCNVHGKLDKQLLLKECIPLAQPAQQILKSYLHDRLECVEDTDEKSVKRQRLEDSNPCGYDLSFRQAGGTSFHAITICREIGLQMCIDDEQRHLFEMLLDENIPLRTVLRFLDTAKLVANNIKLKPVEPAAVTTCHGGLIIKRIEQPVLKLQFHWKVNFEKCVDSPVAEYEGRYVCVGAHSKILRTLDPLTGSELSKVRLPNRIECKVTFLSEQLAMVGCYDGCLYGFNPQTGDIVFNVGIGGMIKSQPLLTADGRRIIVCSYAEDYNVYCLSAERQEVLWCLRIGEKPIFAGPLELPNEQSLIICTLDGSYARVAITDGSVEWTQKLKEPIFSTPVLLESKSNIFLSAEVAGRIHACHVGNGKILATYSTEGNVFSSLVVKTPPTFMGHSFVVFGCIDQHVYCLRCKTGSGSTVSTIDFELHWKINLGAPIYATPSLLTVQPNGLLVWCGATDGRVVLINFRNGEIQWSDKLPGEVFSSACYIESLRRVYVGCRDNFLYCLGI
ncbi:beta-alanine-activating enzyme isoform X1 [Drosophila gunungcola]|uniref:beta-alanine-activating enzyme isoform X1 n=1 Tax=Drosophila gunungcola TaxID=103775 RepID=UPI0022E5DA6E|nr:beta-alanine-activating enzyme isoform X1 [Drosophila gunungcola]